MRGTRLSTCSCQLRPESLQSSHRLCLVYFPVKHRQLDKRGLSKRSCRDSSFAHTAHPRHMQAQVQRQQVWQGPLSLQPCDACRSRNKQKQQRPVLCLAQATQAPTADRSQLQQNLRNLAGPKNGLDRQAQCHDNNHKSIGTTSFRMLTFTTTWQERGAACGVEQGDHSS